MKDRKLILAEAMADALGGVVRPAAVLLEGDRILASGSPQSIGGVMNADRIVLPDQMLLPALVNAHAHLDLTHLGQEPFCGSFVDWLSRVRAGRSTSDAAIHEAVSRGVALARRGGTGLIGDIAGAGSFVPTHVLRESGMPGVSYIEVFGIGRGADAAIDHINRACAELDRCAAGVELGLQPHAPYSCAREVYEHIARLDLPVATHLAETREELQFALQGDGPFAAMLRSIGVLDDAVEVPEQHPVDALAQALTARPWLAAHCNYVDDAHIEQLAKWNTTVAYCPRASDYFGHPWADGNQPTVIDSDETAGRRKPKADRRRVHRYRDMHEAGVRIALGTDSIVCLDRDDRISPLDEMRHLYQRDGTDPQLLLHMATIAGAEALGRSRACATLAPGDVLGVIGLPIDPDDRSNPLIQVMRSDTAPEWIMISDEEVRDTVVR